MQEKIITIDFIKGIKIFDLPRVKLSLSDYVYVYSYLVKLNTYCNFQGSTRKVY